MSVSSAATCIDRDVVAALANLLRTLTAWKSTLSGKRAKVRSSSCIEAMSSWPPDGNRLAFVYRRDVTARVSIKTDCWPRSRAHVGMETLGFENGERTRRATSTTRFYGTQVKLSARRSLRSAATQSFPSTSRSIALVRSDGRRNPTPRSDILWLERETSLQESLRRPARYRYGRSAALCAP